MYRTRINKVFTNTYENLLDAKKEALLSNKKDNSLVEVLDDKDNVVFSKGEMGEIFGNEGDMVSYPSVKPTEGEKDNGVDSSIRALIVSTWNAIDEVNSTLVTLDAMGLLDAKTSEALNIILDDLNTHIGLLEGCLSTQEVE